jgi:hypothetical protein
LACEAHIHKTGIDITQIVSHAFLKTAGARRQPPSWKLNFYDGNAAINFRFLATVAPLVTPGEPPIQGPARIPFQLQRLISHSIPLCGTA